MVNPFVTQTNPLIRQQQQQSSASNQSKLSSGVILTSQGLQSSAGIPSNLVKAYGKSSSGGGGSGSINLAPITPITPAPTPQVSSYIEAHTTQPVNFSTNTYNKDIEQSYNQAIANSNVNITSGFGDNVKGFSLNDIMQSGYQIGSDIYVNRLFSPLKPMGDVDDISHEFGHYLQKSENINLSDDIYTKSATSNTFQKLNRIVTAGEYGNQLPSEDFANSFMNFIRNPSQFKSQYPAQTKIFENALNQIKGSSKSTNNGISEKMLFPTGVSNNPLNPSINTNVNPNINLNSGVILTSQGLQSSAGIPSAFVAFVKAPTPIPPDVTIKVNSSGSVSANGVTYTGNSVVPDTGGLTANQIQQQTLQQAQVQGLKFGQYSAELTFSQLQKQIDNSISKYNIPIQTPEPSYGYTRSQTQQIYPSGTFVENASGNINVIQDVGFPKAATISQLAELKSEGKATFTNGVYHLIGDKVISDANNAVEKTLPRVQYGTTTIDYKQPEKKGTSVLEFGNDLLQSSSTLLWGGDFSFNPLFSKARGDVGQILIDQGFLGKITNDLLPNTLASTALTVEFLGSYKALPLIVRYAGLGYGAYSGTDAALNKELTTDQRIAGGLIAGLSLYGLAQEASSIFKPYDIVQTAKPTYGKFSKAFEIGLTEDNLREFVQFQTKTPEQTITTTNTFRNTFGLKPIIEPKTTPETFIEIKTIEPTSLKAQEVSVLRTEPNFLAAYGTPTRNYQEMFEIYNFPSSLEDIKLVASTNLGRLSFPEESVALVTQGTKYPFQTNIQQVTGEISFPIETTNEQEGFISARILTELFELPKVVAEKSFTEYGAINYVTLFGDVIRTKRGLPIDTFIMRLADEEEPKIGKVIKKSGRKSSPEFFKQLYQEKQIEQVQRQIYKQLPKSSLPKINYPKAGRTIVRNELPSMVGGQGLTILPYGGQGLYEVSELSIGRTDIISKPVQILNQQPQIKVNQIYNQDLLIKQNVLVKQDQFLNQQLGQDELSKQISQPAQIELQKEMQLQKQDQLLKQLQKQETTFDDIFGRPNEETFGGEPPISFGEKKKVKRIGKQVPTYNVLLRRRGRFTQIAGGLPRSQALQFGSEKALKDLARTFKITPSGKSQEVFGQFDEKQFMPSEFQFRQFKIKGGRQILTPDTFIQRSSANLQSFEEKSEIANDRRLSKLMNFKI